MTESTTIVAFDQHAATTVAGVLLPGQLTPAIHSLTSDGRAGALTAIHIPSEQEEAARDLLRCREDTRADLLRAKHRLSKFLLRHGRRSPSSPCDPASNGSAVSAASMT